MNNVICICNVGRHLFTEFFVMFLLITVDDLSNLFTGFR